MNIPRHSRVSSKSPPSGIRIGGTIFLAIKVVLVASAMVALLRPDPRRRPQSVTKTGRSLA
jgi:hypothetical protein